MNLPTEAQSRQARARLEDCRQSVAIDGFVGEKHLAKNGEGLREKEERRVTSNEGVIEEGGATIGEGEDVRGLGHLGT